MKKREEEAPPGAPAWLVQYGDMVTLILTFFILLMSFSTIEVEKFRSAMGSLQGALGISTTMASMTPTQNAIKFPQHDDEGEFDFATTTEYTEEVSNMAAVMESLGLSNEVSMVKTKDGLLIRINTEYMFTSGSADISNNFKTALSAMSKLISKAKSGIVIEGHTDNAPISSSIYPSNWELSAARASGIIRYFSTACGMEANRFKLVGYADTKPIASNDTPEGRAKNRRVDIFIGKNSSMDKSVEESKVQNPDGLDKYDGKSTYGVITGHYNQDKGQEK